MTISRTPPPDFPSDFYQRKMWRTNGEFRFRPGWRNNIWLHWSDGCEVGDFICEKAEVKPGIEDVRIYIQKELVRFDPPLTAIERNRVKKPRPR